MVLDPIDLKHKKDPFKATIFEGLDARPKFIVARFLYDKEGLEILDKICQTEEYYLGRAELAIMQEQASAIAAAVGSKINIVEFGNGRKASLLKILSPQNYYLVDTSRTQAVVDAETLQPSMPEAKVIPVQADHIQIKELPLDTSCPIVGYFPESKIGNLLPYEAKQFLQNCRRYITSGMIISVDLKKDEKTLEAAYNDKGGLTSKFILHVLLRINDEFNATFNIKQFKHEAKYNEEEGRIEINLKSLKAQSTFIAGKEFWFEKDELIDVEFSYKYTIQEFAALVSEAGWELKQSWFDKDKFFSVNYIVPRN
jgi:dimethylhistidine N-methyltransferase